MGHGDDEACWEQGLRIEDHGSGRVGRDSPPLNSLLGSGKRPVEVDRFENSRGSPCRSVVDVLVPRNDRESDKA